MNSLLDRFECGLRRETPQALTTASSPSLVVPLFRETQLHGQRLPRELPALPQRRTGPAYWRRLIRIFQCFRDNERRFSCRPKVLGATSPEIRARIHANRGRPDRESGNYETANPAPELALLRLLARALSPLHRSVTRQLYRTLHFANF